MEDFISGRADKALGTLAHYQRIKLLPVEFFGADQPFANVTPHDADQFGSWLKSKKNHAENTAHGHLKNAKLIFGAAVRAKLITENPFKGISTQLVRRPDRMAFIDHDTIHKVMEACPTRPGGVPSSYCAASVGCGVRPKSSRCGGLTSTLIVVE